MKIRGKSIFFSILLNVIFVGLIGSRYFQSDPGHPSRGEWDTAVHIGIVNHILDGNFFPEWNKPETTVHAVSKYLPLYHGIIGSHLLVALLVLLGLSIPVSMLVISDMALLSVALGMFFVSKRSPFFTAIVFLLIVVPSFAHMNNQGFFSLVVGSAFTFLGLCLFLKERVLPGYLMIALSFFCYPDSAIWILGTLSFHFYRNRNLDLKYKYISYLLFLAAFALLAVFVTRGFLSGRIIWPLTYFSALLGLVCFYHFQKKSEEARFFISLAHMFIVTAIFVIGIQMVMFLDLSIDYYPRKYTYWSMLFLSVFLIIQKVPHWVSMLVFLVVGFGYATYSYEYRTGVAEIIKGSGQFTAAAEAEILSLRKHPNCNYWIHVPNVVSKDPKENVIPLVYDMAFYSYFRMYDLYEGKIIFPFALPSVDLELRNFVRKIAYPDENHDEFVVGLVQILKKTDALVCFAVEDKRESFFQNTALFKIGQTRSYSIYSVKEPYTK